MGKQDLVNKAVSQQDIVKALMAGDITFAQAQAMYNGVIPIGDYKGAAAALDIDLLVKQPLVLVEQQHILGILDGREEDYDLQTLGIVLGEIPGTSHIAALTVPAGEVWYISTVEMDHPVTAGANGVSGNWYCSLWTDRIGALGYGQPFHTAAVGGGAGAALLQQDDFSIVGVAFDIASKSVMLRAPAGTVFTVVFTNLLANAAAAINCFFRLYGFVGKPLVD